MDAHEQEVCPDQHSFTITPVPLKCTRIEAFGTFPTETPVPTIEC